MDGNGRWAEKRGKPRVYGHFEGVESVRSVMETSVKLGIRYVSFFAFSEENWARPGDEVGTLMELMGKAMCAELPTFMEHNVRFMVLGNRERLGAELLSTIDDVCARTAANTGLTMILMLSYSGRWDILQAARRMAHDLNQQLFSLAKRIYGIRLHRRPLAGFQGGRIPQGVGRIRFS